MVLIRVLRTHTKKALCEMLVKVEELAEQNGLMSARVKSRLSKALEECDQFLLKALALHRFDLHGHLGLGGQTLFKNSIVICTVGSLA